MFLVHGNYSTWSSWGACSKSCGDGIKTRNRLCNHPEPEFGGLSCQDQNLGSTTEEIKCAIEDCAGEVSLNSLVLFCDVFVNPLRSLMQ
jgi:hypothetical protein